MRDQWTRIRRLIDKPSVSVIVPCWNSENTIEKAVRSALNQSFRKIEVIVVDAGSTDNSADIVLRLMAIDKRVRLMSLAKHSGPGEARNLGIKRARGRFLTFLDADDKVLPNAYQQFIDCLEKTGSDYAIGGYRRHGRENGQHRPSVVERVHEKKRLCITVDMFPELLDEPVLWNKMFRRSFWNSEIGTIPEDRNYEDQEPCLAAALAAKSIDILTDDVYSWRLPEDRSTRSQSKGEIGDLRDRTTVIKSLLAMASSANEETRQHLLSTILGRDLVMYLKQVPYTSNEYWTELQNLCRLLVEQLATSSWSKILVHDRVLSYLGAFGTRDDIESVIGALEEYTSSVPWLVADGWPFAQLPYASELSLSVPSDLLRAGIHDLTVRTKTWEVTWQDDDHLAISGYAFIPGLDTATTPVSWTLAALSADDAPLLSSLVTQWNEDEWVDIDANDPWRTYRYSGFSITMMVPSETSHLSLNAQIEGFSTELTCILKYPDTGRTPVTSPKKDRQIFSASNRTMRVGNYSILEPLSPGSCVPRPRVLLENVDLENGNLVVSGFGTNISPHTFHLALVSASTTVQLPAEVTILQDDTQQEYYWSASINLRDRTINSKGYFLKYLDDSQVWADVGPSELLGSAKPQRLEGSIRSVTLTCHRMRSVGLTIGPPIPQQYRSRYARQQLQCLPPPPLHRAIVFETFGGKNTGDNPGAIYEQLCESGIDFPIYWSVIDGTVHVPKNAIALIIGTPEWFQVIRSASIIVTNNSLPIFFSKTPGQFWLQTWHGTPIKRLLFDAPRRFVPVLYRRLMLRQVPWWNLLLAQSEEAAANLCRSMRYTGEVLVVEQPRNRRLFVPGTREKTRKRLGISLHEHVILYAPTWRARYKNVEQVRPDYLLNAKNLSETEDCTVLVRMHHMNRAHIEEGARVIDVSAEPYIEDLMCASDELISDYSSTIIDYKLLHKPIRLHTPDKEWFINCERGLYTASLYSHATSSNSDGTSRVPDDNSLDNFFFDKILPLTYGYAQNASSNDNRYLP